MIGRMENNPVSLPIESFLGWKDDVWFKALRLEKKLNKMEGE